MRVILEDDAFNGADELALTGLIHRSISKKCYLGVRNESGKYYTRWKAGASSAVVSALDIVQAWDLFDASVFRTITVCVGGSNDRSWFGRPPRISLSETLALIDTPFRILLENGRYDRAFLLAMSNDDDHDLLLRLENERRLVFAGGGGIDELRELVNETYSRETVRHLRCWALFDSDAPSPGAVSKSAHDTAQALDEAEIPRHMLQRRAIENYMPRGTLGVWAYIMPGSGKDRVAKLEALVRMTPDQRAHYHMKSGFSLTPTADEQTLFKNLSDADRIVLKDGIGKRLSDLYRDVERGKLRRHIKADGSDVELTGPISSLIEMLRVPHG